MRGGSSDAKAVRTIGGAVCSSGTIQPHSSHGDGGRPGSADGDDPDPPHAARVERFVDAVRRKGGERQPQRLPHILLSCERAPDVHRDSQTESATIVRRSTEGSRFRMLLTCNSEKLCKPDPCANAHYTAHHRYTRQARARPRSSHQRFLRSRA